MDANNFREMLMESMNTFWQQLAEFAPKLIGAAALFLIGWVIALALGRALRLILRKSRFNELCKRIGATEWLEAIRVESTPAELLGRIFFWIVFLLFVTSISTTLGLTRVSATIQAAVLFLPRVLFAAIIFALGAGLARWVKNATIGALERVGFAHSKAFSSLIQGFIIILAGIIALEQIDVQTQFVFYIMLVLLTAVGLAIAVTIGLGTRQLSKQLVSGVYGRDLYAPGSRLKVEGYEGELEFVGATMTVLRLDNNKRVMIPNHQLIDRCVELENGDDLA